MDKDTQPGSINQLRTVLSKPPTQQIKINDIAQSDIDAQLPEYRVLILGSYVSDLTEPEPTIGQPTSTEVVTLMY